MLTDAIRETSGLSDTAAGAVDTSYGFPRRSVRTAIQAEDREKISAMPKTLCILIVIAFVAGCTSTGTAPQSNSYYSHCNAPVWSWCAAEMTR
jgi:hypothetical protein